MTISFHQILADHPSLFNLVSGNVTEARVTSVNPPELSTEQALCFISQASHLSLLQDLKASVWISTEAFYKKNKEHLLLLAEQKQRPLLTTQNLPVAMAHVLKYFDRRSELLAYPQGISNQTWIHPTARIATDVTIAPFVVIGPHVTIESQTVIGPHCTIEGDVTIGSHCYIESQVFIGRQSRVGSHCRIKPFASIGADGYGYAPSPTSDHGPLKIPQIGIVVLEDHVDIGSGTCIDRATITQTRIGRGTKIDNLVHIAHNCDIGRYSFITAGFAMAGSTKIGDFFMTGGATAVGDHLTISEKVTLAGASVVAASIDKPGAYGGHPLQPLKDHLRTQSLLSQLPEFRKQLHRILKHLDLKEEPEKPH